MESVEHIWAPRYEPIKIPHPIGGRLNDIVILEDKQFRSGPKKGKGFVYNGAYAGGISLYKMGALGIAYSEEDPFFSGNPSVQIRVKEFIAVLKPEQAVSFFYLQMYVWEALGRWNALKYISFDDRSVRYRHGSPSLEIKALLPEEIRHNAEKAKKRGWSLGGPTIELRVGNCSVQFSASYNEILISDYWQALYGDSEAWDVACKSVRPFKYLFRRQKGR